MDEVRPDVLFVWRGTHIWPRTLRSIRRRGCRLVGYNNDDPFGPRVYGRAPWHHRYLWWWYIKTLKEYDTTFVYRPGNVHEAEEAGARNVHVLMPYFIPEVHHPVELRSDERERYECDVVFIGHYEPDGRENYLRALVNAGVHVRLFGGGYWTREVLGDLSDYFGDTRVLTGADYAKALCGARMCLAFLSKLNRDVYTRRCFEIPACGRLLLSQRTAELQRMFVEDREAVFFSSCDELVRKCVSLKEQPDELATIARRGRSRLLEDHHDVTSRMQQMMSLIEAS